MLADLFEAIYNCPLPVVSVAKGNIYGGGLGILSASDVVIAEKDAHFCFSEVRIGLIPSNIMPYVLKKIHISMAKSMIFTARLFTAKTGKRIGLVDFIIDTDNKKQEVIASILKASPCALKETKKLMNKLSGEITPDLKQETLSILANVRTSTNGREGMNAFLEKRQPVWKYGKKD